VLEEDMKNLTTIFMQCTLSVICEEKIYINMKLQHLDLLDKEELFELHSDKSTPDNDNLMETFLLF
jgi:hypothetical protein